MEVTKKDILRHYLCSLLVYGLILLLLFIMPVFNQEVENPYISYLTVLFVYYIGYAVMGYPILMKFKPQSVLNSRNVVIVEYFKRWFKKTSSEDFLSGILLNDEEKQAFVILFIKAFFGSYCLSLLCNKYLIHLGYDFEFLGAMWENSAAYVQSAGIWNGIIQFIDDTTDMWVTLMLTLTNLVFAFSYLTESEYFKNKIQYADTTFLGIFSCVMCYYPFTLLTDKIMPISLKDVVPVESLALRITIYVLVILANIVITMAVLRLGTKSGNLTNRGIVTGFPYNVVRHPEYSMRMLYVILTVIPMYIIGDLGFLGNIVLTLGMFLWVFVFVVRAITEERNLIKDENYKNYMQRVKHRFIPYLI